ncbi:MAG: A24 family peptidase [Xanthomonadales bacterium]|nr:A24 family peptidase [Xanthomonadales bacterium]
MIGSFLNVVILRLPRLMEHEWRQQAAEFSGQGQLPLDPPPDLVFSRSCCPQCGHQITAFENIPLFSYLWLGGKCSGCGRRISFQYPLVEFVTAVLSAIVAYHFGFTLAAAGALVMTWSLVALSVIDIREQLLPDAITLPLLWIGLLLNVGAVYTELSSAVIGAALGYLSLWLVYHGFKLLTGKEGMGYGDFKLLAAFGAWLGWQSLPLIILLSSLVGGVVGVGMILLGGKDRNIPIPFGPYIAAAGWISMIWGEQIIGTYLRVSGLG